MRQERWFSVTCFKCRTLFEARPGRSARCPSCHHRFPVIRESAEHPGRAVQSADTWDRLVEAGRTSNVDGTIDRKTLLPLVSEVQAVYGAGELKNYGSAIGVPYGQLRHALVAEQERRAAEVRMTANRGGGGADWWQLLELLSCCMTVSLVFVSLVAGLVAGLVFFRVKRRRSQYALTDQAS